MALCRAPGGIDVQHPVAEARHFAARQREALGEPDEFGAGKQIGL